jgi:hypothetical protein
MKGYIPEYAKRNGLKIVDAKKDLTLHLEPRDVRTASKKNAMSFACAQCAKREVNAVSAHFLRNRAYIEQNGKLVRYMLPQGVRREIIAFDRGGEVATGTYTLKRPSKSMEEERAYAKKYAKRVATKKHVRKPRTWAPTMNVRGLEEPAETGRKASKK